MNGEIEFPVPEEIIYKTEDLRYYKGVRPCIIVFKGKKKVIIRFLDVVPHTECITLVRLCWRHRRK